MTLLRRLSGIALCLVASTPASAQPATEPTAAQVQDLRQALDAMQAQVAEARRDAEALRLKLQAMEAQIAALRGAAAPPAPQDPLARIDAIGQEQDLIAAKVDDHEQTKVASGSKYRVRLSGLVLVNVFGTHGSVDNLDLPLVALPPATTGTGGAFSASVRQSFLNLEVFGPKLGGANTLGDVSFDFFGGFPVTTQGVTEPLVRLRTARISLDWHRATLVMGQDTPFFSPRSPTSLASTAYPALSSAGNLWVWTPEVHVQRRFAASDTSAFSLQAGILDPLTGELAQEYTRLPTAGERTGTPAGAVRAGFQHHIDTNRTIDVGGSGYVGRQTWTAGETIQSWAVAGDWDVPFNRILAVSGEAYHGQAIGGFGGGASPSVVFTNSVRAFAEAIPVRSTGGWLQLKVTPRSRIEFNGAVGADSPSRDRLLRAVPVALFDPASVSRNASGFVNAIYQARSNFLLSVEYRHLWTTGLDEVTHRAHHVTFSTGIGF
jgi:hypothetical protein